MTRTRGFPIEKWNSISPEFKRKSHRNACRARVRILMAVFAKPLIPACVPATAEARRKMRNTEQGTPQFVTDKAKSIYTTNTESRVGGATARRGNDEFPLSRRQLNKKSRTGVNSNLHLPPPMYSYIHTRTYVCTYIRLCSGVTAERPAANVSG